MWLSATKSPSKSNNVTRPAVPTPVELIKISPFCSFRSSKTKSSAKKKGSLKSNSLYPRACPDLMTWTAELPYFGDLPRFNSTFNSLILKRFTPPNHFQAIEYIGYFGTVFFNLHAGAVKFVINFLTFFHEFLLDI